MSDPTNDMPETPWWSQPGTTAVLPTPPAEPPPPPPYYTEPTPNQPRRKVSAVLLALALVVGGAVGGGVASAVDHNDSSSNAAAAAGTLQVVSAKNPVVSGTPESAAAVIGSSVVTVEVTGETTTASSNEGFFGGGGSTTSEEADTGSGIIIRSTGYILTNNHVIAADANGPGSVHVTLANGTTVPATIVGADSTTDLAVIKINETGLKVATFADSSDLKVGQTVLAIGAPLGLSNTVTEGIVSTLNRPVATGDSTSAQAVIDAIQTDAAINPGNSGGALVNLAGAVVGIPSAIASTSDDTDSTTQSGNIGVGFAIPSDTAVKVSNELIATGHATHAQIGVSVGDVASSTDGAPGLGAAITAVNAGSPAAKAGLKAGDVVTKVNNQAVTDSDSLIVAIRSYDPGTTVTLTITRSGSVKTVPVTLASAIDS